MIILIYCLFKILKRAEIFLLHQVDTDILHINIQRKIYSQLLNVGWSNFFLFWLKGAFLKMLTPSFINSCYRYNIKSDFIGQISLGNAELKLNIFVHCIQILRAFNTLECTVTLKESSILQTHLTQKLPSEHVSQNPCSKGH